MSHTIFSAHKSLNKLVFGVKLWFAVVSWERLNFGIGGLNLLTFQTLIFIDELFEGVDLALCPLYRNVLR